MKKIATYNGKYSCAVYEHKGKLYISNQYGTRLATKKEIKMYQFKTKKGE